MTKYQNEKATKLLGLLCDKVEIDGTEMYQLFESTKDAEFVCDLLKSDNLLWFMEAGGRIAKLKPTVKTCNTFRNNLLMKDFKERERNEEIKRLEIELAKSNIEANEKNAEIAEQNRKDSRFNKIFLIINAVFMAVNILVAIIQLMKPDQ